MARTPSQMVPLGTAAPPFSLPNVVSGDVVSLEDYAPARALLVMFICNHCPYVVHIAPVLARVTKTYAERGVAVVAISSNDVERYPEDRPERMREVARESGYAFPYLYDASQAVARAYGAACTPDFFLFDADRELVYRGQFDRARPGNGEPITGADLTAAVDALLAGEAPVAEQWPSMGCGIKWKQSAAD